MWRRLEASCSSVGLHSLWVCLLLIFIFHLDIVRLSGVVVVVVVWLLVAGACKRGDLLTFCLTKLFIVRAGQCKQYDGNASYLKYSTT